MILLAVNDLSVGYRTREGRCVCAVDRVSLALDEGEVLGIAGESGCGKSTLALGILGLALPPLEILGGSVVVDSVATSGLPPGELRRRVLGTRIALIPQGALNSLPPTQRVQDLAADLIRSHGNPLCTREIRELLARRFDALGLDRRVMNAYPCQLSGGMRQRVVIAISTLLVPRVVIADEPSSALDVSTQKALLRLMLDLLRQRIIGSMLFITHELPLLYHVADRIAVMYAGQIVELGSSEQVVRDPRHPYTRALMQAMLLAEPGSREQTPLALPGAPPSLTDLPGGCRFAPRCPAAVPAVCTAEPQELRETNGRMVRCRYA